MRLHSQVIRVLPSAQAKVSLQRQASHRVHVQVYDGDACHIRGNGDKWSAVQAQGWQADEILEGLGRGLTGRAIHIVLWTVRD